MPFYSTSNTWTVGASTISGVNNNVIFFDDGGPQLMAHINDFNILVGGSNVLHQDSRYSYQSFNNEFFNEFGINGNQSPGLGSSLIDFRDWLKKPYYYVNCSRVPLEQQQSSSGNVWAKDIGKGSGPGGGGVGGSIAKVLGGAVIGKVLAGKGLKLAKGVGGKAASKISGKLLEKALGKETAETVLKTAGREAAETGVKKGAAKFIGKRIPLVGLDLKMFATLALAIKSLLKKTL